MALTAEAEADFFPQPSHLGSIGLLGPIHMHKIYTCKHFALWIKYIHISKSIFNLRSHANSVHMSILKGTHTCCTAGVCRLLMTAAMLFVHWSCT